MNRAIVTKLKKNSKAAQSAVFSSDMVGTIGSVAENSEEVSCGFGP
jgi:hypothetical protein